MTCTRTCNLSRLLYLVWANATKSLHSPSLYRHSWSSKCDLECNSNNDRCYSIYVSSDIVSHRQATTRTTRKTWSSNKNHVNLTLHLICVCVYDTECSTLQLENSRLIFMWIFTSIQTGASEHVAASNENWKTKAKLKQISLTHNNKYQILWKLKFNKKNTHTENKHNFEK